MATVKTAERACQWLISLLRYNRAESGPRISPDSHIRRQGQRIAGRNSETSDWQPCIRVAPGLGACDPGTQV
jgi:hypothetical protein